MKNLTKIKNLFILSLFFPSISFAAALGDVNDILQGVKTAVESALPIAFGLAVLFFFWGIARYILAEGNPSAKEKGRQFLLWGVIAMFVLASVWGLVQFIGTTLGIATPVSNGSTSQGASFGNNAN